jgi:hypothetical protein
MNINDVPKQILPAPPPQTPFIGKLAILLFLLSYLTADFSLLIDCWLNNGGRIRSFLLTGDVHEFPPLFNSAIYAVLGSILGCGVLDVVSFHKYVAIKRDFQTPHVWGYFFAPWLAAILGLVVFALLQSGLLILGGGNSATPSEVTNLGFLAIGFLSGYGWYDVVQRIKRLITRMFTESGDEDSAASGNLGITERMAASAAGNKLTTSTGSSDAHPAEKTDAKPTEAVVTLSPPAKGI